MTFLSLKAWLLASRPKTLVAAVTPIIVASAAAFSTLKNTNQHVVLIYSLLAFLAAIFIQIGTNFINDALDFKKGADTETRLGPKRVTQSGIFSARKVIIAGFICFFLAVLISLPLVLKGGIPILVIGILSLICAYIYTGGPYPLAYIGLGEVFVVLFFGIVAVNGLFYILTNSIGLPSLVAGVQVGLMATVMIAINNFRDYESDKLVGKMTLAARFGKKFARIEIIFLYLVSYLLCGFWVMTNNYLVGLLPLLTLPFSWIVIKGIYKKNPSKEFNKYLAISALTQLLFGIFMLLGFLM
ncbi:MAG: 1,4-dihydroxy-2-naphthoate polyprenyltransferase [Spirobacillus cienkowskii]|jgi:1,4-dihydroxy-2-naphthoate octaprenyltransferase|uniref:1,4-dihydroxy-2-naphthoate octaprenyltransferase n=1 Tax=Spirobacillus cienkowskii TaxID=495820 RepID=A0A369KUX7_9BACT|nr:MAG: 1,4-dihydroxy-2-naphthoate polyprenyltransferase [Spirobacillus cienkowskii]